MSNYPASRNDPLDSLRIQTGDPTTYPVFQFAFRDPNEFSDDQREWIGRGVNSMIALGPTAVWDDRLPHAKKVVVARWPDDNSTNPASDTTPNAGRTTFFSDGSILMVLDPVGLHGEDAWVRAAAHETGHVMMGSVVDGIDQHVPLSAGHAIMNPTIPEAQFDSLPTGAQPMGNTISGGGRLLGPTQLDFDLYDRSVR